MLFRSASRVVRLNPGESIQVLPNTPLAALPRDKGAVARQVLRALQDAARQVIYQRPNGPGTSGGPIGTGPNGDKGPKPGTGTATGTGTGNTGTGTGTSAPPAPPPPPPPGGDE